MDEKVEKYLHDILISITEIENYFLPNERRFEDYKKNISLKRATERNLEIIGEAVNRILKSDPTIQIENAKQIVGLRNHIITAK